jgi:hypothetical protein
LGGGSYRKEGKNMRLGEGGREGRVRSKSQLCLLSLALVTKEEGEKEGIFGAHPFPSPACRRHVSV